MSINLDNINIGESAEKGKKKESQLSALLKKDISFGSGRLSDKKKERFYSELSLLLTEGVDIKTSLELVSQNFKKADKELFAEISDLVIGGASLSEALRQTGKFSNYEFYSIRIGEESGKLPEILREIFLFYKNKIEQRRKVMSMMSYPVFIFFVAIGAVWFMLTFVVPMFTDVFKQMDRELPALTQTVVNMSDWMGNYLIYILLFLGALVIGARVVKEQTWYRRVMGIIITRIPFFGPLLKMTFISRFCQTMALMISSGTPILTSLNLVKKMIRYYPLEDALDKIEARVMKGESLYECMCDYRVFYPRMLTLIKVAEEVNRLDKVFGQLGKQYSEEVDVRSNTISSVLEPLMIIIIGAFVATILIAMYMPLFDLSGGNL